MDALFVPQADRWDACAARPLAGRDEVIYRSHLVGADPALTKEGGGNFSAKGTAEDHRGRVNRVLWMSAWGCDGATTEPDDFPALRLDELLELRTSGSLSEAEMIGYLADCGLRGEQRRPGIETLTHAFIPARHVDHCHPDAVIALTSFPGGRIAAKEEFGDEAIWFDYRQFDIDVARELADRIAASPESRFVLLANHGLFTWADSSEQCYRNSLEAVARAAGAVAKALLGPADLGGWAVPQVAPHAAPGLLAKILPAIRGALLAGSPGTVLAVNRSADAVRFASSTRGPLCSQAGPSCPDHLVTVGYRPLVLDQVPAGPEPVLTAIGRYRDWYDDYFERHVPTACRGLGKRTDLPRAIVLPGLGVVTAGPDAAMARLCADHFTQTMTVIRAADAAGGYRSLTPAQAAADEYWPLMRLKPQLRPPGGSLSGKVFLVTGPDDDRLSTVADQLAAAGAHVALGGERPAQAIAAARAISARHGERRGVAVRSAMRDPRGTVQDAVLTYGGFDVLVDMTGSAGLVSAALPVFTGQGRPGTVLLAPDERTPAELTRLESALDTGQADLIVNIWRGAVLQPCRI